MASVWAGNTNPAGAVLKRFAGSPADAPAVTVNVP